MGNGQLCIIFHKNNIDRLEQTLPYSINIECPIILLDDSSHQEEQTKAREICSRFRVSYHGKPEQQIFYQHFPRAQIFGGVLGKIEHNLGYCRNYSILLAKSLGATQLLSLDNDTFLETPQAFRALAVEASASQFAATEISGMPDHSAVGHLCRMSGFLLSQYYSSTCIMFELNAAIAPFLNIYNEDWIWLYVCKRGRSVRKVANAQQLTFDPFEDIDSRLKHQEFGEVFWEGLNITKGDFPLLENPKTWELALTQRELDISRLCQANVSSSLRGLTSNIAIKTKIIRSEIKPNEYIKTSKELFNSIGLWQSILMGAQNGY